MMFFFSRFVLNFSILILGLTLHGVYVWIIRNFCFSYMHNIHLFMHILIKKFQQLNDPDMASMHVR
jgi:hypothetical protein